MKMRIAAFALIVCAAALSAVPELPTPSEQQAAAAEIDFNALHMQATGALEKLRQTRYDLVLMDINMPEMNGIEATRRIVAAHPDVVVFLCSTHDVTDLPPGAPTSGARAYINKEHFGADALRQLWQNRTTTAFATL